MKEKLINWLRKQAEKMRLSNKAQGLNLLLYGVIILAVVVLASGLTANMLGTLGTENTTAAEGQIYADGVETTGVFTSKGKLIALALVMITIIGFLVAMVFRFTKGQ